MGIGLLQICFRCRKIAKKWSAKCKFCGKRRKLIYRKINGLRTVFLIRKSDIKNPTNNKKQVR
jgi:hypothetical protein